MTQCTESRSVVQSPPPSRASRPPPQLPVTYGIPTLLRLSHLPLVVATPFSPTLVQRLQTSIAKKRAAGRRTVASPGPLVEELDDE